MAVGAGVDVAVGVHVALDVGVEVGAEVEVEAFVGIGIGVFVLGGTVGAAPPGVAGDVPDDGGLHAANPPPTATTSKRFIKLNNFMFPPNG